MSHIIYHGKSKVIIKLCELVNDLIDGGGGGGGASDFTGATSFTDGTHGLVIKPVAGDNTKTLLGNATWGHDPYILSLIDSLDARVTALEQGQTDPYALFTEAGDMLTTEDNEIIDFEGVS